VNVWTPFSGRAFAAPRVNEKEAELVTGDPKFMPRENEIELNWLKG